MFIFFIIIVIVIWKSWICRKGIVVEHDFFFTFRNVVFSRRCIVRTLWIFPCKGVGWISVFPEKWCSILQFLWCLYFFKIFYGVVVKVFVKVIMSKSPYLSALNQLFAIKLTERFLIFFFAKFFIFCCSLFSCLILKYLRWFNYFSNKYFSTIYKCVAKILYIISRF